MNNIKEFKNYCLLTAEKYHNYRNVLYNIMIYFYIQNIYSWNKYHSR